MVNRSDIRSKVDMQALTQAIEALRDRGCHINPYSVAKESGIARHQLQRSREAMALIAESAKSRAPAAPEGRVDDDVMPRIEALEQENSQLSDRLKTMEDYDDLAYDNEVLRQEVDELKQLSQRSSNEAALEQENNELKERISDLEARLKDLEESRPEFTPEELEELKTSVLESQQLKEQCAELRAEIEELSAKADAAWQQGFLTGQMQAQAAVNPQHEPDSDDATTGSADDDGIVVGKFSIPVDEEALKDPFTAKLLQALQEEQVGESEDFDLTRTVRDASAFAPEPDAGHKPAMDATEELDYEPPEFDIFPQASEPTTEVVHNDGGFSHDTFTGRPEGLDQLRAEARARIESENEAGKDDRSGDRTTAFTTEELHTLFRKQYVKGQEPVEETAEEKEPISTPHPIPVAQPVTKKFVGSNRTSTTDPLPTISRVYPPDVRKACQLLGLQVDDLSKQKINDAWKRAMASGVHPDTGGDTEIAIYLNKSKELLMNWLEEQAPKLGKKFGAGGKQKKGE